VARKKKTPLRRAGSYHVEARGQTAQVWGKRIDRLECVIYRKRQRCRNILYFLQIIWNSIKKPVEKQGLCDILYAIEKISGGIL
jgi:hypothetical protein